MKFSFGFRSSSHQQQFYLDEVPSSSHQTTFFDAQPILDSAVDDQITVAGRLRYQDKRAKPFQQSFILLTAQGDKWKVTTDRFQYQETGSGPVS